MQNLLLVALAASGIVFFAFFFRSLTGFGAALICIPLLALLFDLKFVVPLEATLEVTASVLLLRRAYRDISREAIAPVLIGAVVGSVAGVLLLQRFADVLLKKALGAMTVLFAACYLRGYESTVLPSSPLWGVIAGTAGGIFGGLFGSSGPPFVMYLSAKLAEKETLRATLIALFAVDYTLRLGIFAASGLLTRDVFNCAILLIPALVGGILLGHRAHLVMGERRFKQVLAGILILSGVLLLR